MAKHRKDDNIQELSDHFTTVIEWIPSVFTATEKEMQGLEWGRLHKTYQEHPYNPNAVSTQVKDLYGDPSVKNRRGVFEYILGGSTDTRLLDIRVFEDATKRAVYKTQTDKAQAKGQSNCPLCAEGHEANQQKIWDFADMDADHVTAWSKGGSTDIKNCQMLCKTHNRSKGNR